MNLNSLILKFFFFFFFLNDPPPPNSTPFPPPASLPFFPAKIGDRRTNHGAPASVEQALVCPHRGPLPPSRPSSVRAMTTLGQLVLSGILIGSIYRSEEHTSELQSQSNLVCRLLLEKKK